MANEKIAVFGASGFVGSALCERLFFDKEHAFVAYIHNYGTAARIARFPIEIRSINILEYDQVEEALSNCSTIVNCSRGGELVLLKGLTNIIQAAKKNNIQKFIHISSVAIYGDDPQPESTCETAVPNPASNQYGVLKLKQDEMIFKLNRWGMPSVILCPSNIYGPYSFFVLQAVNKLRAQEVVLVDDGRYPTNLVHIDNLVQAILTAVRSGKGWGERYFVNDIGAATWRQFYDDLAAILGIDVVFRDISRDEVLTHLGRNENDFSLADNLRILASGEFRRCLSMIPIFRRLNEYAFAMFNRLNSQLQTRIREKVERPMVIDKGSAKSKIDQLVKVQIRRVYHSPEKIVRNLGYTPVVSYEEGMESTRKWMVFANII